jgi:hypothetical protein
MTLPCIVQKRAAAAEAVPGGALAARTRRERDCIEYGDKCSLVIHLSILMEGGRR